MYVLFNIAQYLIQPIRLRVSSIDHGLCFRCMNGIWSIYLKRTATASLSGCWSTLSAKVLIRGVVFK